LEEIERKVAISNTRVHSRDCGWRRAMSSFKFAFIPPGENGEIDRKRLAVERKKKKNLIEKSRDLKALYWRVSIQIRINFGQVGVLGLGKWVLLLGL
jgi:hypothetical protein